MNRYWDHERCGWVVYEAPATGPASPETLAAAMPEQRERADEATSAPAKATASAE